MVATRGLGPHHDQRIPLRAHEPIGSYALYFCNLNAGWLRLGAQWHLRVGLETGALSWSTVHGRLRSLTAFERFLAERGVDRPWLRDDAGDVRVLMLDFLSHVRGLRTRSGSQPGKTLTGSYMRHILTDVEQFYAFMYDHQESAARALGEPGWMRLGPQHASFWR